MPRPPLTEALGVLPIRNRLREALVAQRGAEDVPPSRFGLSSLRLLSPRLALPLWLGRQVVPRRVVLTNLFNHTQTPIEAGWSVRKTQVRDFRGRDLTYDSHNGTDLAIPRGSVVTAPAPAVVARIHVEFNRGGLKVMLDHGDGLCTCSAHLARVLVAEGDRLERGQPFALGSPRCRRWSCAPPGCSGSATTTRHASPSTPRYTAGATSAGGACRCRLRPRTSTVWSLRTSGPGSPAPSSRAPTRPRPVPRHGRAGSTRVPEGSGQLRRASAIGPSFRCVDGELESMLSAWPPRPLPTPSTSSC